MLKLNVLLILSCLFYSDSAQVFVNNNHFYDMKQVFSWKQIGYNIDGITYTSDSSYKKTLDGFYFKDEIDEKDMYFKQYNNVPIGLEVYKDRVFITVPRRRYGITSTLNYVDLKSKKSSPLLKPYPDSASINCLVSTYRPRVDVCGRLWVVDTGLLEIPNNFEQKSPPTILAYDLNTDQEVLRYRIPSDVLVNDTTSGLTSITIDVTPSTCNDAYAYINDLAREGLIVFSLAQSKSWRISHNTFKHDPDASNFDIGENTINWKDGLFSIALSDPDEGGKRTAYYHPFISTQEFSVSTDILKVPGNTEDKFLYKLEGVRGAFSQSCSHDFHSGTKTLLFANVAQDAIMCWNTKIPLTSKMTAVIAQDHKKLVYIADLKVVGDEVWVLVNQITNFIYGTLKPTETNFYVHKGKVEDLIRGSACDIKKKH